MEILKCVGVTKVYDTGGGQVIALDHIDLSVEKGEFTAIGVRQGGAAGSEIRALKRGDEGFVPFYKAAARKAAG